MAKETELKILVTGGSGFTGYALINLLLAHGHDVINIDKNPSGIRGIKEICHDLTYPLTNLYEEIDLCIHLASGTGGVLYNQNSNVVEYNSMINKYICDICNSNNIHRFIFFSSLAACEQDCKDLSKAPVIPPNNMYAFSKWKGEIYFQGRFKSLAVVRPANIFGKAQLSHFFSYGESHVIPDLIHKIQNEDEVEVWGDGSQTRNFIHVSDICDFILSILNFDHSYKCYNLASTMTYTIKELVEDLITFVGKPNVKVKFNESYMKYEFSSYAKIVQNITPIGKIQNLLEGLKT